VCPWNKFLQHTAETDFHARHELDNPALITLFNWTETEFLSRTEGSAIRRIGFDCWQRNIAVAMGNAPQSADILEALAARLVTASPMVAEHINWAIEQQQAG
jgi:epoxyqueuosine reductase